MGIEFTKGEIDKVTETVTWFVRFYGTKDAKEMEDLLIKKDDWASIKLAQGSKSQTPPLPPWSGRGEVPDGSKSFLPDYSQLQVNISGIPFKHPGAFLCRIRQEYLPMKYLAHDEQVQL